MATIDTILWAILIIMGVTVVILTIWGITLAKKYKIKFTVKELVNGRIVKRFTKAKEYLNQGIPCLKVLKYKNYPAPMPPPEAIELDHKGNKCVEAYLTPNGEFIYTTDRIIVAQDGTLIKLNIAKNERDFVVTPEGLALKDKYKAYLSHLAEYNKLSRFDKIRKKLKKPILADIIDPDLRTSKYQYLTDTNNRGIETIDPLTTSQRAFYLDQLEKVAEDKAGSWNWLKENAALIAGTLGLVILAVVGLMVLDSWYEHSDKLAEQEKVAQDRTLTIIDKFAGIDQQIQRIENAVGSKPPTKEKAPN